MFGALGVDLQSLLCRRQVVFSYNLLRGSSGDVFYGFKVVDLGYCVALAASFNLNRDLGLLYHFDLNISRISSHSLSNIAVCAYQNPKFEINEMAESNSAFTKSFNAMTSSTVII